MPTKLPLFRCALAVLFLAPSVGSAWEPIAPEAPVWASPYEWSMQGAPPQSLSTAVAEGTLLTAMEAWTAPPNTSFRATYGGRTTETPSEHGDERSVVSFADSWSAEFGDPSSVIAITVSLWVDFLFEADMLFNEEVFTFVVTPPGGETQADLQSIATHEMGHALGLGHSTEPLATMSALYDGGTDQRSLSNDDLEGLRFLYPGNGTGHDDEGDDDDTLQDGDDDDDTDNEGSDGRGTLGGAQEGQGCACGTGNRPAEPGNVLALLAIMAVAFRRRPPGTATSRP